MRVDLHVHTHHSRDSLTRPQDLAHWMGRRGIDVVAVTDHNTIDGAREASALFPGAVIVGEEVCTTRGEVIGLFLQDPISAGLSPRETLDRIHAQGGLAYVPHPFDRTRGALAEDVLLELMPRVDLIEVYNAKVLTARHNDGARALALAHGVRMGAGSDAHRGRDVGLAWVEVPPFDDAAGFLTALDSGEIHGRLIDPLGRFGAMQARLARVLGARRSLTDREGSGGE